MARKLRHTIQETVTYPAIYLRVSTDEQADSGLGLAAQEARCRALCDAKGWTDPVIYKDEGISGTFEREKRPGLDMLLAAVEAGTINAVIVLDLSRLGRKVTLVIETIETLEARNAVFVSCKESFDTTTAMGKAMLNLVAVFGQLERDLISERTTAALEERGKQYGYRSGKVLNGYRRDGERIVIDEERAAFVREVFALRDEGNSMRAIGKALGKAHSSIQSILQREYVYRGQLEHWPAILH